MTCEYKALLNSRARVLTLYFHCYVVIVFHEQRMGLVFRCDTGGTLCKAAQMLKEAGATEEHAAVTHGILSNPALTRISASEIDRNSPLDTSPNTHSHLPDSTAMRVRFLWLILLCLPV